MNYHKPQTQLLKVVDRLCFVIVRVAELFNKTWFQIGSRASEDGYFDVCGFSTTFELET